jgi:hypothetical protein
MAAKLVVVSGKQPGAEYWIESEVLRIGSEPPCEIRLPDSGVPAHAATLEFRDDGYAVYNRSDGPLSLDHRPLAPRAAAARWPAGKDLYLSDELALRLVIEGDPTPAKRAAPRAATALEEEAAAQEGEAAALTAEEEAKKNKNLQAVLVLVLAALAIAVLLVVSQSSTDDKKTEVVPPGKQMADVVAKLRADKSAAAADSERYCDVLQTARVAELRGDKKLARDQYQRLYDWLRKELDQRRAEAPDAKLSPEHQELFDFVKARLQSLIPKSGGGMEF